MFFLVSPDSRPVGSCPQTLQSAAGATRLKAAGVPALALLANFTLSVETLTRLRTARHVLHISRFDPAIPKRSTPSAKQVREHPSFTADATRPNPTQLANLWMLGLRK
jgi:hypothetical protein